MKFLLKNFSAKLCLLSSLVFNISVSHSAILSGPRKLEASDQFNGPVVCTVTVNNLDFIVDQYKMKLDLEFDPSSLDGYRFNNKVQRTDWEKDFVHSLRYPYVDYFAHHRSRNNTTYKVKSITYDTVKQSLTYSGSSIEEFGTKYNTFTTVREHFVRFSKKEFYSMDLGKHYTLSKKTGFKNLESVGTRICQSKK